MGVMDFLFGKKPKPFDPKNVREYESAAYKGVMDRNATGHKPITGAAGVQQATAGYDFNPQKKALAGFGKPNQFNFTGLPQQYGAQAYESAVKDLRREGSGQLEQLRENVGVRRPGLLAKVSENMTRQLGEREGALRRDIGLEEMRQNVQLNQAQQQAQADEDFRNLSALAGTGQNIISQQSGLLDAERGYQDRALEYLMQMYSQGAGLKNQKAQMDAQNKGGFLNTLVGLAAPLISAAKPIP